MSVPVGKYTGGRVVNRLLFVAAATVISVSGVPAAAMPGRSWRAAPEYVELFTPGATHPGHYETYVSPLPIDAALRESADDPALLHPPGAWTPRDVIALDAFGKTGAYNRWALARLYGARRTRLARGPRGDAGRVVEMWTLISPYPDIGMQRLESGTLLIVLRLP
jgi:hypothetical protein